MRFSSFLPILVATGLVSASLLACDNSSLSGGAKTTKDKDEGDDNDEGKPAAPPIEVAGAFLTECGPASSPELVPGEGQLTMGCAVVDKATKRKISTVVTDLKVTLKYGDGTSTSPTLTAAPAAAPWHGYFIVPSVLYGSLKGISLGATVDGKAGTVPAESTKFDPSPTAGDANFEDAALAFVSKATFRPGVDFMAVDDADEKCRKKAQAQTLPMPVWRAIITDATRDVKNRVPVTGAVYDVTGFQIAGSAEQFWDSSKWQWVLNFDETGRIVGNREEVWTGVMPQTATCAQCGDWSSTSGANYAGIIDASLPWLSYNLETHDKSLHLYCIGQKH